MQQIIGIPVFEVNRYSGIYHCDNIEMTIGTRLKEARKAAGLTQAELATRSGTKHSTISDLEVGKSKGATSIAQMAAVLGVNALWLETGKGDKASKPASARGVHPAEALSSSAPALQWITSDEYLLLNHYRAATNGWKTAILEFADEAEKEPSVRITDHKTQ